MVEVKVDEELIQIIDHGFTSISQTSTPGKHSSSYKKILLDQLQTVMVSGGKVREEIAETLLTLNFNSRSFCLYYIERISDALDELDSTEDKLRKLSFHYKLINQIQFLNSTLALRRDYVSVKEFIGNWIAEEIAYHEKDLILRKVSIPADGSFKVIVDMSVAQFTCFVRALMERRVLLNSNLTELSSFLSKVVATKRSETMSDGSFRRKYYNIEDNTKRSLIEIFSGVIDWLKKN